MSPGTPLQNGWRLTSSLPASKSKPSCRHQPFAQRALSNDGKRAFQRQGLRFVRLQIHDPIEKSRQKSGKFVEQRIDPIGPRARFVDIHQGFVDRPTERFRPRLTGAADEFEDGLEVGFDGRVVVGHSGLAPGHFALAVGSCHRRNQIGFEGGRMHPSAAHLSQIGGAPGIVRHLVLRRIEQVGHRRVRGLFVHDPSERGELFRPPRGTLAGHVHRPVPGQHARRLAQRADLPESGLEDVVAAFSPVHPVRPPAANERRRKSPRGRARARTM